MTHCQDHWQVTRPTALELLAARVFGPSREHSAISELVLDAGKSLHDAGVLGEVPASGCSRSQAFA